MAKDAGGWVAKAGLAAALIAPAMALTAAVLIRVAPDLSGFARQVLIGPVGNYTAWAGLAVAVLALVHAFGNLRRRGLIALLAVAVAGTAVGLYWKQAHTPGASDVSTNPADPPMNLSGVSSASTACDGLEPLASQRTVEEAAYVLQNAGFAITHAGLFDIQGERKAFWFQEAYSLDVRIRPGRTDVRVVTRNGRPTDGGAACRLALKVRDGLQPKA